MNEGGQINSADDGLIKLADVFKDTRRLYFGINHIYFFNAGLKNNYIFFNETVLQFRYHHVADYWYSNFLLPQEEKFCYLSSSNNLYVEFELLNGIKSHYPIAF